MNPYELILSDEDYYLLNDDDEIPIFKEKNVNLIYDWGGFADGRLTDFLKSSSKDLIVMIPFTPDIVSYQSALSVFNEIKEYNDNIIFVLNRAGKGDIEIFEKDMKKRRINKALFEIKESKLFKNIFNKKEDLKKVENNTLLKYSYKKALEQIETLKKGVKNGKN